MSIFTPIQMFADWLTYSVFGLLPKSIAGEAINFFIFDTIKIFLLLLVIIFVVSMIRSFLPPEKIRSLLSRKHKVVGNLLASLLGIITPFCSCSAVPLFLGFIEAGVPLGITFSFLVASPMINEVALVMLLGLFGIKVALIYIGSGLVIAILSGLIIGHLKVEHLLESSILRHKIAISDDDFSMTLKERIIYSKDYTWDLFVKIWPYVLVGIGLGAWIHGYVPADFLAKYAGADKWYGVPLATLIGIPLYSNAAGVIPLVNVLFEKGVPLGTVLAFMMAVTALSLPEFLILKRVMRPKLILIFASIVGFGIIITGYVFNYLFS